MVDVCVVFSTTSNILAGMQSHHDLKEIYWRSRRGMLELELKLVPFVRDCFNDLTQAEKAAYVALLSEEDWQIFDWLQGRTDPPDATTGELIEKIGRHAGKL